MSKKLLSSDEAFRRMFGKTEASPFVFSEPQPKPPEKKKGKKRGPPKRPPELQYIGTKIYLSKIQKEALYLKAKKCPENDMSGHVRAALNKYLQEELAEIRKARQDDTDLLLPNPEPQPSTSRVSPIQGLGEPRYSTSRSKKGTKKS